MSPKSGSDCSQMGSALFGGVLGTHNVCAEFALAAIGSLLTPDMQSDVL